VERRRRAGGITLVAHRTDGSVSEPAALRALVGRRATLARRRRRHDAHRDRRPAQRRPAVGDRVASTVAAGCRCGRDTAAARRARAGPAARRVARGAAPLAIRAPASGRTRLVLGCRARDAAALSRPRRRCRFGGARGFDSAYNGTGNWSFKRRLCGRARAAWHGRLPARHRSRRRVRRGGFPGRDLDRLAARSAARRAARCQRRTSDRRARIEPAHVLVNDPAHPAVAVRYPRPALDVVFREHGGSRIWWRRGRAPANSSRSPMPSRSSRGDRRARTARRRARRSTGCPAARRAGRTAGFRPTRGTSLACAPRPAAPCTWSNRSAFASTTASSSAQDSTIGARWAS